MASTNPCCMPLKRGVILLTTIEIVLDIVLCVLSILAIIFVGGLLGAATSDCMDKDCDTAKAVGIVTIIVVGVVVLVSFLISIGLACLLRKGANRESEKICQVWLIISIIFQLLSFASIIYNFVQGQHGLGGTGLAWALFKIYQIYVVLCFRKELLKKTGVVRISGRYNDAAFHTGHATPVILDASSMQNP